MKKAILLPASFVLAALACSIVCGCAVGERASIAGSLLEIRDNETADIENPVAFRINNDTFINRIQT